MESSGCAIRSSTFKTAQPSRRADRAAAFIFFSSNRPGGRRPDAGRMAVNPALSAAKEMGYRRVGIVGAAL